VKRSRRKSGRNYRLPLSTFRKFIRGESPVLVELEKISLEVGLPETEVRNLVTYAGVRREPGGFYDDREILKLLVKHFREQLYGCAAADYAEKRRVEKFSRPQVARFLASPKRRRKSPGSGNLISR
jgi:hypothetical protein